jgi:hypothetical protein
MKPLLLSALLILAPAGALADGGAVQLRKEAGGLVITVFASPSPLSIGPADISLLLQNRDGLDPVLDANVSLLFRQDDSGIEFQARPTHQQARNKLLYAAPVMFSRPGGWRITVTIKRNGEETSAAGILQVIPARDKAVSYAGYLAFPPVMIVLFVIRERLIRRRSPTSAPPVRAGLVGDKSQR